MVNPVRNINPNPPPNNQVNNPLIYINNQVVSIRDALTVVPDFSGSFRDQNAFIAECEEAGTMIEDGAERNLVRLLRTNRVVKLAAKLGKQFQQLLSILWRNY